MAEGEADAEQKGEAAKATTGNGGNRRVLHPHTAGVRPGIQAVCIISYIVS